MAETKKTTKVEEAKEEKSAKKAVTKTVKAETEKKATTRTTKTAKTEKVEAEKPAKTARASAKTEAKAETKASAKKVEEKVETKKAPAKKPAKKAVKGKAQEFQGTGKRKCSVARVRLTVGTGVITVNGESLDEYFDLETLKTIVKQPLVLTDTLTSVDVTANIYGGGKSGQAGALRHGITRALIEFRPELRPELKKAGFVTRDARKKERKKYGLHKARKAPQFSKR